MGYNVFNCGMLTHREIYSLIESYCWELNPKKTSMNEEEQIKAINELEQRNLEKKNDKS